MCLTGTVEAAVEPNELRVDPTQMFTLQSDGWWNKSSIKGSYGANGVSTGLNATSEGQAGVILSNVVGTIATLAPMAVAFAGDAEACRKEVVDALAVIADKPPAEDGTPTPSLKDVVKTQTRELAELTATVNRLSAQATALGPAATTEDRTAFRDAIKAMTDKTAELAANQQALDDALKAVTLVSEEVWPRSGDEFASTTPFRLDQKVFEDKWANVQRPELSVTNFDVYLDLRLKDAGAPGGGVQTVIDTARGIPVRFAQTGVVRVCATLACNAPGTKVVKSFEAPVLQLGRVVMVPVSGGGWRSTTAGVALDAGGNPTTIEMGNTVSVGERRHAMDFKSRPEVGSNSTDSRRRTRPGGPGASRSGLWLRMIVFCPARSRTISPSSTPISTCSACNMRPGPPRCTRTSSECRCSICPSSVTWARPSQEGKNSAFCSRAPSTASRGS